MIPPGITAEMIALQAQLDAAAPLANAPFNTIKAIQLNLDTLRADIDASLKTPTASVVPLTFRTNQPVPTLDDWQAPIDPAAIVAGFNTIVDIATDKSTLSLMRGLVGRVELNVDAIV